MGTLPGYTLYMITIYENKEARDATWKANHLAEHSSCNFFMPECDFMTDEKLTAYAFGVLEASDDYNKLFKEGSLWSDSDVFVDTRRLMIADYEEINEELQGAYLSRESLLGQYWSDLVSHILERGQEYDVYDIAWRIHAGKPAIEFHQDPLCVILTDRIQKAVFYLMGNGHDISKFV